jgi:hypothetical protein|tara:strand:+ start:1976 stop:2083 length:108 start_codon:yes stop_codon:yes gene_type:complete
MKYPENKKIKEECVECDDETGLCSPVDCGKLTEGE